MTAIVGKKSLLGYFQPLFFMEFFLTKMFKFVFVISNPMGFCAE